jgi:hypothetical protein
MLLSPALMLRYALFAVALSESLNFSRSFLGPRVQNCIHRRFEEVTATLFCSTFSFYLKLLEAGINSDGFGSCWLIDCKVATQEVVEMSSYGKNELLFRMKLMVFSLNLCEAADASAERLLSV